MTAALRRSGLGHFAARRWSHPRGPVARLYLLTKPPAGHIGLTLDEVAVLYRLELVELGRRLRGQRSVTLTEKGRRLRDELFPSAEHETMRIALEELRDGEQVWLLSGDIRRDMALLRELGASGEEIARIEWRRL